MFEPHPNIAKVTSGEPRIGQIGHYSQSKEEKLYVICHSGVRSRLAAKKLKKKGYDVVNVSGGMRSWTGDVI